VIVSGVSRDNSMTAQKLYEILKLLDALDTKLNLQTSLEAVREALSSIVSQPAQPQHQSALASALAAFTTAADKLNAITPSQALAIKEMDGEDFFDPLIADKVRNAIQTNAMTPSVARDFVQDLATKRAAFLATVRGAKQNLEKLGVRDSGLQPGSADLAFLIPRDLFQNQLAEFAKELNFISRLLQDFGEAITGHAQPVELEQLSSSVPTVALLADLTVITAVAHVVNMFLDAWGKIEKIRKIRTDLTEIGMTGVAVDQLTEQITTTVDEVVEESTEFVLKNYQEDGNRKNELANALRQDARRLFGQIERGLTVEIRVEPKPKADADTQKALEAVTDLTKKMQFPLLAHDPMLLKSGEILEGELKHSKKTTTHRATTTTKKETRKDGKPETKE
jgi:hypothetical protein